MSLANIVFRFSLSVVWSNLFFSLSLLVHVCMLCVMLPNVGAKAAYDAHAAVTNVLSGNKKNNIEPKKYFQSGLRHSNMSGNARHTTARK